MSLDISDQIILKDKTSVFLVGFTGSGKTTIGRLLATSLKCSFTDLDTEIQISEGMTINHIFESRGEEYFRVCERALLRKTVIGEPTIISTGGGTAAYSDNMDWMKSRGKVIFLKARFETLLGRLSQNGMSHRPLVTSLNQDDLKAKYLDREKYYNQADIIIDCELFTAPDEIIYEICKLLNI